MKKILRARKRPEFPDTEVRPGMSGGIAITFAQKDGGSISIYLGLARATRLAKALPKAISTSKKWKTFRRRRRPTAMRRHR